jgi:hypothetical protein
MWRNRDDFIIWVKDTNSREELKWSRRMWDDASHERLTCYQR